MSRMNRPCPTTRLWCIPNIEERIKELIAKYRRESMDIEDVTYEEADLEEDELWKPIPPDEANQGDILQ